jgi:TrmH family RNA methyltransferase
MGSLDMVAVRTGDLSELCGNGEPTIALETGGVPITAFDFPRRGVLIVGSEELGIRPETISRATHHVSILTSGPKRSLNVGAACAVALYAWQAALER